LRCDLVTLSACESGLNRVRRGDELVGLMRAFVSAGARALIASLWRVDERSTCILMERFYQETLGGAGFADALKRAQVYLMNLTRQEARATLVRAAVDELLHPAPSAHTPPAGTPRITVAAAQSQAYLKGDSVANDAGHAGILSSGPDDEHVFADPYYWAAFILIGSHGSG
jgi:CHAT domain-containing protein